VNKRSSQDKEIDMSHDREEIPEEKILATEPGSLDRSLLVHRLPYLDVKFVNILIREALKKEFGALYPTCKFTVKLANSSQLRPVHITWSDGPSIDQVLAVAFRFRFKNDGYVMYEGKPYLSSYNHTFYGRTLAWELLQSGGHLATIGSASFPTRQEPIVEKLRALVEEYGSWQKLPSGMFTASGTDIPSVVIKMRKP
jgi:hypothetical protein